MRIGAKESTKVFTLLGLLSKNTSRMLHSNTTHWLINLLTRSSTRAYLQSKLINMSNQVSSSWIKSALCKDLKFLSAQKDFRSLQTMSIDFNVLKITQQPSPSKSQIKSFIHKEFIQEMVLKAFLTASVPQMTQFKTVQLRDQTNLTSQLLFKTLTPSLSLKWYEFSCLTRTTKCSFGTQISKRSKT